jgi:NAD(P)-dependent dehydrogenase (short-subunit alcohol dehydrogenase family)
MQDLTGKTAVVTGAAGGIGLGLARRFVAEGMAVVIADIDEADLKSAAVALEADGADVLAVATDVGDRASVDALADAAYERFGSVHVVCANAGVAGPAADLIWDVPPGEFARVYGVNVFGLTNTIGAFVPRLIAGGEAGHVVLTTSLASFLLYPAAAPYFSSKHAALAVADILRAQLAAVAPLIGA